MPLTVGGGVRSVGDIRKLLASGADKVSINTAAVARRGFVKEAAEKFGEHMSALWSRSTAQKVSTPGRAGPLEIFTHGGRNPTSSMPSTMRARWWRSAPANPAHLLDRDGARRPTSRSPAPSPTPCRMPVIASGGVGTLDHLVEGIRDSHATAVLAASIFHFGEHSVRAAGLLARAGLPMRLDP